MRIHSITILVVALSCCLCAGCVSTTANYRHLERGRHEFAVGANLQGVVFAMPAERSGGTLVPPYVFPVPNIGPEFVYKYGLSERMDLRLQIYNTWITGLGANIGFSYLLLRQGSVLPELDLFWELGAGELLVASGTLGNGPGVLNYYLRAAELYSATTIGLSSSYFFESGTVAYGGLLAGNPVHVSLSLPPFTSPRAEVFFGVEQGGSDWISVQLEARLGAQTFFGRAGGISLQPHSALVVPYAVIFPGIRIRTDLPTGSVR